MAHMRRQQKNVALADRHVVELAAVDHLELVEELLDRIVVIVGALVRAADHLHSHGAVLEHLLVADRRLEQVLMLLDPALEVEGVQSSGGHGALPFRHAADERRFCPSSFRPQVSNARRVASFSASVSSSIGRRTAPPYCPSSSCQYFEWAWNFSGGRVRRIASRAGLRLSRTALARATSPRRA